MSVIPFPSLVLTEADEAAILAEARSGGHYCCRRETGDRGHPTITLLDRQQNIRGHITKCCGIYAVADARGWVIKRSSSLAAILSVLSK